MRFVRLQTQHWVFLLSYTSSLSGELVAAQGEDPVCGFTAGADCGLLCFSSNCSAIAEQRWETLLASHDAEITPYILDQDNACVGNVLPLLPLSFLHDCVPSNLNNSFGLWYFVQLSTNRHDRWCAGPYSVCTFQQLATAGVRFPGSDHPPQMP